MFFFCEKSELVDKYIASNICDEACLKFKYVHARVYIMAWYIYCIIFQRAQEFSKSLKQAEKGKEAMRRS